MIGYEFEFLMEDKEKHEPITHEQFEEFHKLLSKDGWENGIDNFTKGIIYSKKDGIKVTTDDSIYVLEVNFPPKKTINECNEDAEKLMGYLSGIASKINARILGIGMFPGKIPEKYDYVCNKAFIKYITPRRYWLNKELMHRIAGCQYWFDVPKEKMIEYLNIMNKLNGISVALMGNSPLSNGKLNGDIEHRLKAWEGFVDGPYEYDKETVGIPSKEFEDLIDFFNFCFKSTVYGIEEQDELTYYLEDHSKTNGEYFFSDEVEVIRVDGKRKKIKPRLNNLYNLVQKNIFLDCRAKFNFKDNSKIEDFKKFYKEKDEKGILDMLGKSCIECRFIGSQNKDEFSTGGAFLLGLLENLEKTKEVLGEKDYSYWVKLRENAIKNGLNFEIEGTHISNIVERFLKISEQGLKARGQGEEKFLEKAKEFVSRKENPGQRKVRLFEESGIEKVLEDCAF